MGHQIMSCLWKGLKGPSRVWRECKLDAMFLSEQCQNREPEFPWKDVKLESEGNHCIKEEKDRRKQEDGRQCWKHVELKAG